ncbi:hypothetical protein LZD49_13865 [Dyadobacter sp. CY261]|uniref:hypothetical protein n=1 Tax=Dyadobacter sp. CY261 TaxID=2907203 RepID=UPI001F244722|nr:hypothetical protein [Dyadobacter sp. CY261]MCF0071559.1 hypothetical protein [Dyadobacter sp. CY261]
MQQKKKSFINTSDKTDYTLHTLLTVAALALFLLVQRFLGAQVFERVKRYKQEYRARSVSLDTLMADRFGLDYMLPKYMVEFMKPQKPVLLTPPAAYIRKYIRQSSSFSLTNPIYMFYMNSEVRIVCVDSPDFREANCAVLIDQKGQCYPTKIKSKADLESIVRLFKSDQPYRPSKQ